MQEAAKDASLPSRRLAAEIYIAKIKTLQDNHGIHSKNIDDRQEFYRTGGTACKNISGFLKSIQDLRDAELASKVRKPAPQPVGLAVTMRDYQRESLAFMLEREVGPSDGSSLGVYDAFYTKLVGTDDNTVCYYSPLWGKWVSKINGSTRGGILAEEMGLGKTIESLGIILANPRPSPTTAKKHMALVEEDAAANPCHRERIARGALELGGTLVVCKVSLVGQWCEEYRDKLVDKNVKVCEYHGQKRKKWQKDPHLLGAFDLVVTTYETLAREFRDADKTAKTLAESESWVCKLPTAVWNEVKEMDEYTGSPCGHANSPAEQVCAKCGGQAGSRHIKSRIQELRRTGEVQAPVEKFFWHRIIADESHTLRNPNTNMSRALSMLAARNRWCVTGTPFTMGSNDLLNQLNFVGLRMGRSSKVAFESAFRFGMYPMFEVCSGMLMRHTKEQKRNGKALLELGDISDTELSCPITTAERTRYNALFKAAQTAYQALKMVGLCQPIEVYSLLLPLRKACSGGGSLDISTVTNRKRRKVAKPKPAVATAITGAGADIKPGSTAAPPSAPAATAATATAAAAAAAAADAAAVSSTAAAAAAAAAVTPGPTACEICHDIATQCMISQCQHKFCRECIFTELAKQKGNSKKCPVCKKKLTQSKLLQYDPSASAGGAANAHANRPKKKKKTGRRLLLNSKQKMLVKLIKKTLESAPDEKSLVFSNFLESLEGVSEALGKEDIATSHLNGTMTLSKRKNALKAFAKDPKIKVMLLTMQSGSVGINLTSANHVYLLEPSYNPALEAQAVARAWRMGQRKKVFVHRMFVPESIEQRMLERTKKLMFGPPAGSDAAAKAVAVGARVMAKKKAKDKQHFPGAIEALDEKDKTFSVKFDDGSKASKVLRADIIKESLIVGSRITARWKAGGKHYPGVISAVASNGKTFAVLFDDGDRNPAIARVDISKEIFAVGARVKAKWDARAEKFPGVIVAMHPNGTFKILFDDSDSRDRVKAREMELLAPAPKPVVNSAGVAAAASAASSSSSSSFTTTTSSSSSSSSLSGSAKKSKQSGTFLSSTSLTQNTILKALAGGKRKQSTTMQLGSISSDNMSMRTEEFDALFASF